MTDTAKPTSDKGCTVKLWDRANFRYFVSDEAVDVYHETGLTPRQLLEQRDALQERVRELEAALTEISTSRFCDYEMTKSDIYEGGYGIGVTDGHRYCANIAKAALAKHGEGV